MFSLLKSKFALFGLLIITGLSLYNYKQYLQSTANQLSNQVNSSLSLLPRALHQIPIGIYEIIKQYSLLLNIKENNKILNLQNSTLKVWLQNTLEIKQENKRLKKLLALKATQSSKLIAAKVTSADIFGGYLSISIDKGYEDGVRQLQGILSTTGTVGIVKEVSSHRSQVILLLSQKISIDSINQRSRVRSLITGYKNGSYTLIYPPESPPTTNDIQLGDLFVSSGLQNSFPAGLHIGRVTKITREPLTQNLTILLQPTVSFNTLEEVFIIKKP